MSIFLFCKQIVDMLYQFKFLDYGMVLFALVLICYKFWKDKIYKDIKGFLCPEDGIVIVLMAVYALSFLRYPAGYGTFFKIESCFLIYFVGRLYGKEILQQGKMLAYAGYLIVYVNFIYRFYQFGFKFILTGPEVTLLNVGGLYFYKTDLAIGIIIAALFIYMFSENKWLKWITIVPVCGYMVFYSGARMGQIVMVVEYVLILLCELEKRNVFHLKIKWKLVRGIFIALCAVVVVLFVALQVFPFEEIAANLNIETGRGSFIESLMHSRHIVWSDILKYFSEQPLLTRFLGIDLETEYMHNAMEIKAHSAYIKQIYATGYLGCGLLAALIGRIWYGLCREKERNVRYIVLILWAMLLGAGLTVESLESTQMSWFPMLFTGILFVKEKNGIQTVQEQSE